MGFVRNVHGAGSGRIAVLFFAGVVICFFNLIAATLVAQSKETPNALGPRPLAERYQPDCAHPQNHDDADYCLQLRDTNVNRIEMITGSLGVGVVAVTLLLSILSVRAAVRSVKAADKLFTRDRAWLLHSIFRPMDSHNTNVYGVEGLKGYSIEHSWINCGSSPALRVRAAVKYKIYENKKTDPNFEISDEEFAEIPHQVPVGQGQHTLIYKCFIPQIAWDEIMQKKKALAIYSRVEYADIFNSEQKRISEVCGWLGDGGSRRMPGEEMKPVFSFAPAGRQNTCS